MFTIFINFDIYNFNNILKQKPNISNEIFLMTIINDKINCNKYDIIYKFI